MRVVRFIFLGFLLLSLIVVGLLVYLAQKPTPETISYGMSFNTVYARELGLDWKETYGAILGELGVRKLRLAAHWPMIEPLRNQYNFEELDYQVAEAEAVGATIVLAVGRRLPRWPECHIPDWARGETWDVQKQEIREYLTAVVNRYKDSPAVL